MDEDTEVEGELIGQVSFFLRWDDAASHDSPNSFWIWVEVTW